MAAPRSAKLPLGGPSLRGLQGWGSLSQASLFLWIPLGSRIGAFPTQSFERIILKLTIDKVTLIVLRFSVTIEHQLVQPVRRASISPISSFPFLSSRLLSLSASIHTGRRSRAREHLFNSLTPFLSHHSTTRTRIPFTLISFHKTGGYTPAWYDHTSSFLTKDCRLTANGSPLSPFAATLTQKRGGTPSWSYQFRVRRSVPVRHSLALTVAEGSLATSPLPPPLCFTLLSSATILGLSSCPGGPR
jgi:hypothetical protein